MSIILRPKLASVTGKVPVMAVVHEYRGLNPYIEGVACRVIKVDYARWVKLAGAIRTIMIKAGDCRNWSILSG